MVMGNFMLLWGFDPTVLLVHMIIRQRHRLGDGAQRVQQPIR
jgi:hypothetical protein